MVSVYPWAHPPTATSAVVARRTPPTVAREFGIDRDQARAGIWGASNARRWTEPKIECRLLESDVPRSVPRNFTKSPKAVKEARDFR